MFIYMLFCVKRMEQRDIIYDEFYENYRSLVRDCRIIESGRSRDLELVFKAEDEKPFISFAQKALQVHEFIKPDVEFAYDDGQFHFLFIDEKKVKEEDRHSWDFTSELTYSRTFFGTDDDFKKIVEEWAKEIHADDEQKKAKLSRLQKGK